MAGLDLRGDNDTKGCVLEPHSYRFPCLQPRTIKPPFVGEFASSLEKQLVWQCLRACVLLTNKLQRSVTARVQLRLQFPVPWAAVGSLWHGVSFQLSTAGQAFPVLAGGLELIAPATAVITLKTLGTCWHRACSLKDKHLPRVIGRPFQHKDPWTLLDAKLMTMKLHLVVASVMPLSNSKSLPSHRTEEALKKELSHFPNSHSKGTAETEKWAGKPDDKWSCKDFFSPAKHWDVLFLWVLLGCTFVPQFSSTSTSTKWNLKSLPWGMIW